MNGASMPPEDPEGVDRAYQRASAADPSRPGSGVRASILSQARRSVDAPRAASDDRWRWQAAAGIAAIGLVGAISWHFVRVAGSSVAAVQQPALPPAGPSAPELVPQDAQAALMDRMDGTSPSAPSLAARSSVASAAPRAAARAAASPAASPAESAAPAALRSARAEGPRERQAGVAPLAVAAAATATNAAPGWRDQALQAARMRYPELFGPKSARGAAVTITIALNADGTVYRSTQTAGTAVVPAARDASARVSEFLSLAPKHLVDSGVLAAPDGVTVVYGVLAPSQ